ncbi:tRNA lysidine(34) synthetase TilS [Rhodospirillaceae bacterium KN72]|uniref:tRNA(Ile)-lysidine synthase n=1 Tax=Pacificispira spongiicola TaxID=2729598 RepID=A0A7Y0HCP2_9PROT|nr:tRNA lysidine(34) synthetase TilS [Pacificispira spongiicola]NMM42936.1 tRNA lysidine(34) synthetase TilS [Pacificispira spongiicola]
MTDGPITEDEFEAALCALAFPEDADIHVACSGGPDSMALAILARDWAQRRGRRAVAVVVDHGLRPEASAEAETVGARLRDLGLAAIVLHYDGAKPTRDIQAAAREIRYRLIGSWLARQGLARQGLARQGLARQGLAPQGREAPSRLLLAHHQEDQAETLLLRLARGSGVDGLSAMSPLSTRDAMTLYRPLLSFPKARLAATVQSHGVATVDDPSNRNTDFARVRMRGLQDVLAAEGLTPARLADTAARMARARDSLNAARDDFLTRHATARREGFLTFPVEPYAALTEEIALRVLSEAVRVLGGRSYPAREAQIAAAHAAILDDKLKGGRTLAGAGVRMWRGNILICREAGTVAGAAALHKTDRDEIMSWDGRFDIRVSRAIAADLEIGALGTDGVTALRKAGVGQVETLPGPVRASLPTLRDRGGIVCVPHLNYTADGADLTGEIAFRPVSSAWGEDFRGALAFSNGVRPLM